MDIFSRQFVDLQLRMSFSMIAVCWDQYFSGVCKIENLHLWASWHTAGEKFIYYFWEFSYWIKWYDFLVIIFVTKSNWFLKFYFHPNNYLKLPI